MLVLTRRRLLQRAIAISGGLATALTLACGEDEPGVIIGTTTVDPTAEPATEVPTSPPTPAAEFDVDLHVLVDKARALPDGYVPPNLEYLPPEWHAPEVGGLQLRSDVIDALRPMFAAAAEDGVELRIRSAYRSYDEQAYTFDYWVSVLGEEQARRESAEPGHSEHQLATTADFASGENGWELLESFADTTQGEWLAGNAHQFGFAMSYPRDGESITGYIFEPWHYRYIGIEASEGWRASGLTLVEFLESLQP